MGTGSNEILDPPQVTSADRIMSVNRAVAQLLPGGGSLIELFSETFSPSIERRKNEWISQIARRLIALEQEVETFRISSLSSQENFISILASSTAVAMRQHNPEKRRWLLNAVTQSALDSEADDVTQQLFVRFVDSFTPDHIRVLSLYCPYVAPSSCSPSEVTKRQSWFLPRDPENTYELRKSLREFATTDLCSHGLLKQEYTKAAKIIAGAKCYATDLGKAFLDYIEPEAKDNRESMMRNACISQT